MDVLLLYLPSADSVAQKIIAGVKSDEEYIFPDEMSTNAGKKYMQSPRSVEQQFAR